jgi:hypothetical protein
MNLNFAVNEVLKNQSLSVIAKENDIGTTSLKDWIRWYLKFETKVLPVQKNANYSMFKFCKVLKASYL